MQRIVNVSYNLDDPKEALHFYLSMQAVGMYEVLNHFDKLLDETLSENYDNAAARLLADNFDRLCAHFNVEVESETQKQS